jgi:hypothetical protein
LVAAAASLLFPRLAKSRNNKGIVGIKTINKGCASNRRITCFGNKTYLRFGGRQQPGEMNHLGTVKATAGALTVPCEDIPPGAVGARA